MFSKTVKYTVAAKWGLLSWLDANEVVYENDTEV
jgi:hypothetical protein